VRQAALRHRVCRGSRSPSAAKMVGTNHEGRGQGLGCRQRPCPTLAEREAQRLIRTGTPRRCAPRATPGGTLRTTERQQAGGKPVRDGKGRSRREDQAGCKKINGKQNWLMAPSRIFGLLGRVANLLYAGPIVAAWFRGRSKVGPGGLGLTAEGATSDICLVRSPGFPGLPLAACERDRGQRCTGGRVIQRRGRGARRRRREAGAERGGGWLRFELPKRCNEPIEGAGGHGECGWDLVATGKRMSGQVARADLEAGARYGVVHQHTAAGELVTEEMC